jgi:hypothetical protein
MHNSCNLGVIYVYTLDSVSSTDGDDGETDLLELLSVQHQSTAVLLDTAWFREAEGTYSKTKAGLGQLA